ncbi:lysophospholipid acyltransferase family protein [Cytophagales bacterium LB-30]|uniref:Lysophospholipid acyltransferase family protein n=1 Tax=Shiella aurantiaca TaxID=3058365 RepID=A0ABT8F191_9BACT|nr:lysophospholipid acyltransferase family protein [Shiella aurantiaca]MDN4164069.1 lysophospholipid acyltransferase family protein [Shiella aurantiaca]
MLRPLYALIFIKILGWRLVGNFPHHIHKFIVAVAPHTSNWDFLVGLAGRSLFRIQYVKFLGKSQLFKWPYGFLFRWLGGYPVDRSKHNNLVDQVVEMYRKHERFAIALAPEGTRSKVSQIKTGFYHIARKAEIPIILVGFDYAKKQIIVRDPFYPSVDAEADMVEILNFFKGISGKYPELGI